MKYQKLFTLLLVSCIFLSLIGCGSSKKEASKEELEKQISELQAQLDSQNGDSSSTSGDLDIATEDNGDESTTEELEFTAFQKGDSVKDDILEFTVDNVGINSKIEQSAKDTYLIHYFEAETGKYVYLKGTMKNVSKSSIDVDSIWVKYIFDSGYEYYGQVELEKNGEFQTFGTLKPLESATFYVFADIPTELLGKDEIVNIKISYGTCTENQFSLTGREEHRYVLRTKV
jgi:hypothetical protein